MPDPTMPDALETAVEIPASTLDKFQIKTVLIQPQTHRVFFEIEKGETVDGMFVAKARDSCELLDTPEITDPDTGEVTPATTEYMDFVAPMFESAYVALKVKGLI